MSVIAFDRPTPISKIFYTLFSDTNRSHLALSNNVANLARKEETADFDKSYLLC